MITNTRKWQLMVCLVSLLFLGGCNSDDDGSDSSGSGGGGGTVVIDTDGDGIPDNEDSCPDTVNDGVDVDADGIDDACDTDIAGDDDIDNDTILNGDDNCPAVANTDQANLDSDLLGDACDTDRDGDGFADQVENAGVFSAGGPDNCPLVNNPTQSDRDSDGTGDLCDVDTDGDGVDDKVDNGDDTFSVKDPLDGTDPGDNCPLEPNAAQTDTDGDGEGDACESDDPLNPTDDDGDGVVTGDNCPTVANPDQEDLDGDNTGDACDVDQDGDTVNDKADVTFIPLAVSAGGDNCPSVANTDQADTDGDELGDACDSVIDNDEYECGIGGQAFTPMLTSDADIVATVDVDTSDCLTSLLGLGSLTCSVDNPQRIVGTPLTDYATIANTGLLGILLPSEIRVNVSTTTGFAYPADNIVGVVFEETPQLLQLDLIGGDIGVRTLLNGELQEESAGGVNADLDLLGLSGVFDLNDRRILLLQTHKRFDTVQIYSTSTIVSALENIGVNAVCASKTDVIFP